MKRRIFSVFVALALCLSLLPGTALAEGTAPAYSGGDGTEQNPYQISSVADLQALAEAVNNGEPYSGKFFKIEITGDSIDLSSIKNWTPIGTDSSHAFQGTFDGNGKTISGLKIDVTGSTVGYYGLFGYVGTGGTVKNLAVSGSVSVEADADSAVLVGGIVGWNDKGTIENCRFSGSVSGSGAIGSCFGGVAGRANTIQNCCNTGSVSGRGEVGGVVGYAYTIENSYNTGSVNGSGDVGGVAGRVSGNVSHCFYLDGTADKGVGYMDGGTDTTAKKNAAKFATKDTFTGWDFTSDNAVWVMGPFRPLLSWEAAADTQADGSSEHPYQISTVYDLESFRDFVNNENTIPNTDKKYREQHYQLVADLQLNEAAVPNLTAEDINLWTPIGKSSLYSFKGTFDGNGHTISGLAVRGTAGGDYGLFGYVGTGGTVKNLTVSGSVSVAVTGNGYLYVGGVVGENYGGTVENCHFSGSVDGTTSGRCYVGGVVGYYLKGSNPSIALTHCSNSGDVTGNASDCAYIGGVVGYVLGEINNNTTVTIDRCFNTGKVEGSGALNYSYAGGTAGYVYGYTIDISSCYNTGAVSGDGNVGGVAGCVSTTAVLNATNCFYRTGITGDPDKGVGKIAITGKDTTTPATATQFSSGEIAWKLQEKQDTQVWGQTLTGDTKDASPVFTADTAKTVCRVDFQDKSGENYAHYSYAYANPNKTVTTPTDLTKEGYTLSWSTAENGGTAFTNQTNVTKNTTVYSHWTANHYTVSFDKNADDATDTMADQDFTYDAPQALTANAFRRSGYTFAGWAKSSAGEVEYADEASVSNLTTVDNGKVTLYACWTGNPYTVAFDKNAEDATGEMTSQTFTYGTPQALTANAFQRSGYTFAGWATSAEGAVVYADNAEVSNLTATKDATVTLYAQWTVTPPAPSGGGGGGGGSSTPSTPTVTVPVSSETDSVSVKATVKNGTASVEISDKQINQVAAEGAETVTVDLTGLKNVESATLPAHVVETTGNAEDVGLTVALPTGTVSLDSTALNSLPADQDVTVSVKQVPATDLNDEQQAAVGDMANIGLVFDVEIWVNGEQHTDLNGGTVTISIPYTPKKGENPSKLTVWYIRDDGMIMPMGGYYDEDSGCFVFEAKELPLRVS